MPGGGHAAHQRQPLPGRGTPRRGWRAGAALPRGRAGVPRQDQYAGARHHGDDRVGATRPLPESLEPRPHLGWLERRLGLGHRSGDRAAGARQRRSRLDPHSRRVLRAVRTEDDARTQSRRTPRRCARDGLQRRPRREPDGARFGGHARCHRLPGARGSLRAAAEGAALHGRGRHAAGPAAHRVLERDTARGRHPSREPGCHGRHGEAARGTRPRGGAAWARHRLPCALPRAGHRKRRERGRARTSSSRSPGRASGAARSAPAKR